MNVYTYLRTYIEQMQQRTRRSFACDCLWPGADVPGRDTEDESDCEPSAASFRLGSNRSSPTTSWFQLSESRADGACVFGNRAKNY